jgi:hypothetical protein
MPIDWLLDPGVPAVALKAPVVETWPDDVAGGFTWNTALGEEQGPVFCDTEAGVATAWHAALASRYKAIHLNGRLVKAVHLPHLCGCIGCHPEYHGRAPRVYGKGVMYSSDTRSCLCHPRG